MIGKYRLKNRQLIISTAALMVFLCSQVAYAETYSMSIQNYNLSYLRTNAELGSSLAIADINGDGEDDLIIGARGADHTGTQGGSVYIIYSSTLKGAFFGALDLTDSDNYDIRYDAETGASYLGEMVAVGDVNNDGENDLVIGAPLADFNGQSNSGSVYVILSNKLRSHSGNVRLNSTLNYNIRYDGYDSDDYLGSALAIGDVNEDGKNDLIMGAERADFRSNAGAVYVLFSDSVKNDAGNIRFNDTSQYDRRYKGARGSSYLGHGGQSVLVADVNGDGKGDLLMGEYQNDNLRTNSGTVYVILSSKLVSQIGDIDLNNINNTSIRYDGHVVNANIGRAIAVGDVDGDSSDELVIGSERNHIFIIDTSKVATHSGAVDLATVSNYDIRYNSQYWFGSWIDIADVNNDGEDDLLTVARNSNYVVSGSGAAFVLYSTTVAGHSGDVTIDTSNADLLYHGTQNWRYLGDAIVGGDINEDDANDMIIGHRNDSYAYVVLGDSTNSSLAQSIYESNDSDVTPSSPGSPPPPGRLYSIAFDDGNPYSTGLSEFEGGYDSQVFKMKPDLSGISSPVFFIEWDGYGEAAEGFDVELSMWNFTTQAWEQMDQTYVPDDNEGRELFGYKIGQDYIDSNGEVWVWARAYNEYSPPTIISYSAVPNYYYATMKWTSDVPTTGFAVIDTVSHADGTWQDYSLRSATDSLMKNHNLYSGWIGAGTTYYYRIRAFDADGDPVVTDEKTFATWPCFAKDTLIAMADGTEKMIQEVKVGERVISWDLDNSKLVEGVVEEVWSGKQGDVYEINKDIKATWAHPFWTKEVGWASINPAKTNQNYKWRPEQLALGQHIMDIAGDWVEITSIEALEDEQMTYNLSKVSDHHNYFAQGILAHNKFCAFLFAKDKQGKEAFEFVTLGVFEEPGNINSRLVNDRIFKENDGYSYLKLKNDTNKFVLRIPPHQMDFIDHVYLKVRDKLNVKSLSLKDQKLYEQGKLKEEKTYELSLVDSSAGVELMNAPDNRYYRIADEEGVPYPNNVELTFEKLPKIDQRYTREVIFVEKGYYEPFEGAKIWYDQKPFNQTAWREWLDTQGNEAQLAYIIDRETIKHNRIVRLEHQLAGQNHLLQLPNLNQIVVDRLTLTVEDQQDFEYLRW